MKKFSILTFQFPIRFGFTLIELLVVIAMMATLTALGIASYASYNGSQVVQTAASDVVNMLNTAKSQAISQVKPSDCGDNPLSGYQVTIDSVTQQYILSASCGIDYASLSPTPGPSTDPTVSPSPEPSAEPSPDPGKPHMVVVTTRPLPPQVNFDTTSTPAIFFAISTGTVTSGGTITISGYGKTKIITVSTEGSMSVN